MKATHIKELLEKAIEEHGENIECFIMDGNGSMKKMTLASPIHLIKVESIEDENPNIIVEKNEDGSGTIIGTVFGANYITI